VISLGEDSCLPLVEVVGATADGGDLVNSSALEIARLGWKGDADALTLTFFKRKASKSWNFEIRKHDFIILRKTNYHRDLLSTKLMSNLRMR
jgi:hypothetical protein